MYKLILNCRRKTVFYILLFGGRGINLNRFMGGSPSLFEFGVLNDDGGGGGGVGGGACGLSLFLSMRDEDGGGREIEVVDAEPPPPLCCRVELALDDCGRGLRSCSATDNDDAAAAFDCEVLVLVAVVLCGFKCVSPKKNSLLQ